LTKAGVRVMASHTAKALLGNGKVAYVELDDGQKLGADAVILSIGVRPNMELAQKAELEIGPTGCIAVDHTW